MDFLMMLGIVYSKIKNDLRIIPMLNLMLLIRISLGFLNPPGEEFEQNVKGNLVLKCLSQQTLLLLTMSLHFKF
jgi:hypothetical protein